MLVKVPVSPVFWNVFSAASPLLILLDRSSVCTAFLFFLDFQALRFRFLPLHHSEFHDAHLCVSVCLSTYLRLPHTSFAMTTRDIDLAAQERRKAQNRLAQRKFRRMSLLPSTLATTDQDN